MNEKKESFLNLVKPYCSQEQISRFEKGLEEKPCSGLLLNPYSSFPVDALPSLEKDDKDPLLYRFDKKEEALGKSVPHFGGAFYILDPSSALISYYLKDLVEKNPLVLDLCAAPGGKSIAFSFRRKDCQILANDISYSRANEIQKNADRLGLVNIASMSMDPMKMDFPPMFDLVILDVPCSGSGMIRKEKKMMEDWSEEKVKRLLPLQRDLMEKSLNFLKRGGILAYSTCSLSAEEDELQVEEFLSRHREIEEIRVPVSSSVIEGTHGYHMIPGIYPGEGIYFCLLRKKEGNSYLPKEIKGEKKSDSSPYPVFSYKKNEYSVHRFVSEFSKLPFLAPGIKKYDTSDHPKCPYDHAYSKIMTGTPLVELNEKEAIGYVKGEEIQTEADVPDGLCILCYQGTRLGFGKKKGKRIKNYLPKGLRIGLLPLKGED